MKSWPYLHLNHETYASYQLLLLCAPTTISLWRRSEWATRVAIYQHVVYWNVSFQEHTIARTCKLAGHRWYPMRVFSGHATKSIANGAVNLVSTLSRRWVYHQYPFFVLYLYVCWTWTQLRQSEWIKEVTDKMRHRDGKASTVLMRGIRQKRKMPESISSASNI